MIDIDGAERFSPLHVWARGGQAPLRAQATFLRPGASSGSRSSPEPLITFISSERTVVHAGNTGGVLSGQRAAIRSRLAGFAASAPGRTARGSPGRHR
jgi:hypothetical protein